MAGRRKLQVVTEQVLDNITNAYKENAPEFVYFVTLYNIFNEFLEDISEDVLPNEATGFKSSVIWNKLYNFQRDAALAIINKLEKYNGCILADSVGPRQDVHRTFRNKVLRKPQQVSARSLPQKVASKLGHISQQLSKQSACCRPLALRYSLSYRPFASVRAKQRSRPRIHQLGQLRPCRY